MDLAQLLLPDNDRLALDSLQLDEDTLRFFVRASTTNELCPQCRTLSIRIHSRYERTLKDLPCCKFSLRLIWQVRRFFCENPRCKQQPFAEQHVTVANRYARRTCRLQERLGRLGHETGGQMGGRLAHIFDITVSHDTVLRLVRGGAEPENTTPRVIGIDDWALQKGHTYGTIIIDHERAEIIDLLPDRQPETIAGWLANHPGVEIVTRDRGQNYIDGVTLGAPAIQQVADRFHLLQNLTDALKRMFDRSHTDLKAAQAHLAQQQAQSAVSDGKYTR